MRFRTVAQYPDTEGAREQTSGAAAYRRYHDQVVPLIEAAGGRAVLLGRGGDFLIRPAVHRTAACEDTRLLPLEQVDAADMFV